MNPLAVKLAYEALKKAGMVVSIAQIKKWLQEASEPTIHYSPDTGHVPGLTFGSEKDVWSELDHFVDQIEGQDSQEENDLSRLQHGQDDMLEILRDFKYIRDLTNDPSNLSLDDEMDASARGLLPGTEVQIGDTPPPIDITPSGKRYTPGAKEEFESGRGLLQELLGTGYPNQPAPMTERTKNVWKDVMRLFKEDPRGENY